MRLLRSGLLSFPFVAVAIAIATDSSLLRHSMLYSVCSTRKCWRKRQASRAVATRSRGASEFSRSRSTRWRASTSWRACGFWSAFTCSRTRASTSPSVSRTPSLQSKNSAPAYVQPLLSHVHSRLPHSCILSSFVGRKISPSKSSPGVC